MRKVYLPFEATALGETELAFKCTLENDECTYSETWVPKSVIHRESLDAIEEAVSGEKIEIHIAQWWVKENL